MVKRDDDSPKKGARGLLGPETMHTLSRERERFEKLLAEMRALQTGGHAPAGHFDTPPPARPSPSWLVGLDVLVRLIVIYALVVGTPLGAIIQRGWVWMTDSSADVRPLLSYFSQPSLTKSRLRPLQTALKRGRIVRRRKTDRTQDPLPAAVAFLFSEHEDEDAQALDVRLPKVAQQALRSVAVLWPGDAATPRQREDALRLGLKRLRQQLGADEAAVAALAVEPESLAFALQRARVSGAEHPGRFEVFERYLTHEERRPAASLVHGAFALAGAFSMTPPIEGKLRVTSPFGYRHHPVLRRRRLHKGIDFGVPIGTPVLAAQAGEVAFVGADGVNGRFIRLDHGHGLTTTYCHLDSTSVEDGEDVARGKVIAKSGNSGRSTGPHLHFQVEFGGTAVDPALFR